MITSDYREDTHVLIVTYKAPFDPIADTANAQTEIEKYLDTTEGDLHYIADMGGIEISFSDLVEGLAVAFQDPNSIYRNPRLSIYTVGTDQMIEMGAKAANDQSQYGNVPIKLYRSVDAALAEITGQSN